MSTISWMIWHAASGKEVEVGQGWMREVKDSPQQGYQRERWWHMVNGLGLGAWGVAGVLGVLSKGARLVKRALVGEEGGGKYRRYRTEGFANEENHDKEVAERIL